MQTVIAQTFLESLARLTADEQKQAKQTFVDIQLNPENPGLQYHRVDRSKDKNFWSVRVNRDIRIIVHKLSAAGAATTMIAYVAHHDDAYDWAERRRIDVHSRTGAVQLVEVRERFVDQIVPADNLFVHAQHVDEKPALAGLKPDELLDIGVPEDWVSDLLEAGEGRFLSLCDHIPTEAAEKLLVYAADGILPADQLPEISQLAPGAGSTEVSSPYEHPDTLRRLRVLENIEDLEKALEYPWEKWMLYLHPSQARVVQTTFKGPARVAGSAGTGKTVVALHRAARVLRDDPNSRLLLTTFSRQLAASLQRKLWQMFEDEALRRRVRVLSFDDLALELFTLINGYEPRLAKADFVENLIRGAIAESGTNRFREQFISSEWDHVVDAWQLKSLEGYETVPRIGRRQRLGKSQRAALWPIFEKLISSLAVDARTTIATVKNSVFSHYQKQPRKPFTHVIVDEAQDLSVPDLRLLSAIAPSSGNALFFAGDLGQRIFQEPFSWSKLGIDVRGRSHTLKVNYRTSHQIRSTVDRLLPDVLRDADGIESDRTGTVSVFNGPKPQVSIFSSINEEDEACRVIVKEWLDAGNQPGEIAIFVREHLMLGRVRKLVAVLGVEISELSQSGESSFTFQKEKINIGTMHQAKGMEFKSVLVMGCNDDCLPLESRVDNARDVDELNSIIETERHLLYVSATRARENLLLTAIKPASEFLEDLNG